MKFKPTEEDISVIYIVLNITCIVIIMMCLWAIDISASAMTVNAQNNLDLKLTNGFRVTDPMKMYHYGLWGITISSIVMIFSIVNLSIKNLRRQKE